jgi:hypothetical protein
MAAVTPIPALAPILKPSFPVDEGLGEEEGVVVVDIVEEDWVIDVEGSADHCDGATAWKDSDVGIPVQPLLPQQCHSPSVLLYWIQVVASPALRRNKREPCHI